MRKTVVSMAITALLTAGLVPVSQSWAQSSSLDKVNEEIRSIRSKINRQKEQMESVQNRIQSIQRKQSSLEDQLIAIDLRRNATRERIDKLEKDIEIATAKAVEAQQALDEATERVKKRDQILKMRVKSMYERGNVSYLEVLLGATSFADFLNRLDGLKLIVEQDTRILEENKRDQDLMAQKKKEVDQHLKNLENMMAEAEQLKIELEQQYQESQRVKAELEAEEQQLHEIEADMEQELLALAAAQKAKLAEKAKLQQASSYSGGQLGLPLAPGTYRLSSPFGSRTDPITGRTAYHNGLDFAAPEGTPIYAAEDGVVIFAGYSRGFGNTVMIQHNEEITTLYAHIREGGIMVSVGQTVKRGDKIAEVGSTGRSTGNHLHFTVYKNDVAVDPKPYLK